MLYVSFGDVFIPCTCCLQPGPMQKHARQQRIRLPASARPIPCSSHLCCVRCGLPVLCYRHDAQCTPADLLGLLQVHGILQHKDWEARTAAGYCLGLIAEHVQHHDAAVLQAAAGQCAAHIDDETAQPLPAIDIQQVLKEGSPLLASGGQARPTPTAGDLSVFRL